MIHMYSPPSMGKGLFHRVIAQSPSLGIAFKDVSEQISVAKEFAKQLGCGMFVEVIDGAIIKGTQFTLA